MIVPSLCYLNAFIKEVIGTNLYENTLCGCCNII